MNSPKLFMTLLGCCPKGRLTEQHDVFFGIADNLIDLVPSMNGFWPEANGNIHLDAWRTVSIVDGYVIEVVPITKTIVNEKQLFFINLGGYVKGVFDEAHHKMLVVAANKAEAILVAKATDFYKRMGFEGATSHIDDKYGVDVDEIFMIEDVLTDETKAMFQLKITKTNEVKEDELQIGYMPLKLLKP